jgi:hypothetical protein
MVLFRKFFIFLSLIVWVFNVIGQDDTLVPGVDHSYKPMILKLDESGYKYMRFLIWSQFHLTGTENVNGDFKVNPSLRRFRFLTYAQFSPDFKILAHWGTNSLDAQNMDPTGNTSDDPQLFLHAAWIEYNLMGEVLTFGSGLHYWNGLSRQSSASTLTLLTLDNYRQSWSKLGLADQFARNLGMFIKGQYGKFSYNLSLDAPLINSLDVSNIPIAPNGETLYTGRFASEDASWLTQGYFKYDIIGQESCLLPYKVASHLSKNHVLSVGAGFLSHPNGTITYQTSGEQTQNNVRHYAVDVFYDVPLNQSAITAYLVYYYFDYGPDYSYGTTYGTGNSVYGSLGYLFPPIANRYLVQPYLAVSQRDFEAFEKPGNTFQIGTNFFLNFHQAKLTLEYENTLSNYTGIKPSRTSTWRLQMMVYM